MKTARLKIFHPPLSAKTKDPKYKGFEYRSLVDGYGCVHRVETVTSERESPFETVLIYVESFLN